MFIKFLRNILQLLLAPGNAWRDVGQQALSPKHILERGLYPFMAVMGLTVFVQGIYEFGHVELITILQRAICQFAALITGLFLGRAVMDAVLPRFNNTGREDAAAVYTVAVYVTGVMCLFLVIGNLLPARTPLVDFLPVFAVIILWRSSRYLDLARQGTAQFMIAATLATVVPVILVDLLLGILVA